MIAFFMKKMIRVLLPRQQELEMIGKVALTLQDVSPFESPESFHNRAALDLIFSSVEASVRCMVGHRHLGKVIREAFHEYAKKEATQGDGEQQRQNPRLPLPPVAAGPDASPPASPSPSVSSLPSFLQIGSDPRAPLFSSSDSDTLDSTGEEMHELGEAATKFRDAMMQRPTNVWDAPWDEDDTAAESFGRKMRALAGVPASSGDFRKAGMIGLWMLAASLMGLGIAAIVIFPLGTLFLWLGALAVTVALLLLVLIPLVTWASLHGQDYKNVAFYLGTLYRGAPTYRIVKSADRAIPSDAEAADILAFQSRFENLCQDTVAAGKGRDV